MFVDFADGFDNVIHVVAAPEKEVLRHGNCCVADQPVAFELFETFAIGLEPCGAEKALEAARVYCFVEQTVEVLFVIPGAAWNAFGVERSDEFVVAQPVELVCVVAERVEMPDWIAVFGEANCLDARDGFEAFGEMLGVGAADFCFLDELVELLHEDDGLELLHSVIAAAGEIGSGAFEVAKCPAAIVERLATIEEIVAVSGYGAAFAGWEMFGILEAETAEVTKHAAFAALVFGEPRLAGILDHGEFVFAGDCVDRVHIAWKAVDMDGQNGASAVGDSAFN